MYNTTGLPHKVYLMDLNRFDLENIISRLSFNDLNRVLYRCDGEERDDGKGLAAYEIPGCGPMVYCGLQGNSF